MKSDYHAEIINEVLCIYDLNKGAMSVTNDIENVIKEALFSNPAVAEIVNLVVIYRDSEGRWDEVKVSPTGKFENFAYIGVDLLGLAIQVVKNRRKFQ